MKSLKKKIILLVIFLLALDNYIFSNDKDNKLVIMSFNILGTVNSEYRNPHDKDYIYLISKTIKQADADIVLLQESYGAQSNVFYDSLVLELKKINQGNYKYKSSYNYAVVKEGDYYKKCNRNMHNAILYNTAKVKLKKDIGADDLFGQVDNLKYKFQNNNVQVLKFEFNQNEFIVINVHLPNKERPIEKLDELREIRKIYNKYKNYNPIIIGGDFNTSREDLIKGPAGYPDAIVDRERKFVEDFKGQPTTLGVSIENIKLVNDFDHFIIKGANVVDNMRIVYFKQLKPFYDKITIGTFKFYSSNIFKLRCSDHLPIMIGIEFPNKKDD